MNRFESGIALLGAHTLARQLAGDKDFAFDVLVRVIHRDWVDCPWDASRCTYADHLLALVEPSWLELHVARALRNRKVADGVLEELRDDVIAYFVAETWRDHHDLSSWCVAAKLQITTHEVLEAAETIVARIDL